MGIGMTPKRPGRKRSLTADEAELWAQAMRGAKAHQRKSSPSVSEPVPISAKKETSPPGQSADDEPAAPPKPASAPRNNAPQSAPPGANFDHRHKRKLLRNTAKIDSRIDLHGMRQIEAYGALRRFLHACAARGDRNVLVITGKGRSADFENRRDYMAESRGVLRRLVPQWLGEPEFRSIVISFTQAGPRHGGDGALYLHLRKFSR